MRVGYFLRGKGSITDSLPMTRCRHRTGQRGQGGEGGHLDHPAAIPGIPENFPPGTAGPEIGSDY
jgi:hypothetical protein